MMTQLDFPFEEVCARADRLVKNGADIYFKFTCKNCGTRQTFDVPNVAFETGSCEECGAVTNLRLAGCNYLVVVR